MTAAAGAIVTETGAMDLTFDTSGMLFADGDVITLALDNEMSVTSATPTCTENLGQFTVSSCTYDSVTNTISMTVTGLASSSPSSISITVNGVVYPNSSTASYPVAGGANLELRDSGGTLKGSATDVKIVGTGPGTINAVTITHDPAVTQVGLPGATISFDVDVAHNIQTDSTLEVFLPLEPVSGDHMVTSPTCTQLAGTMSAGLTCVYDTATQILTLSNLLDADSTGPLQFSVSGVTNPIDLDPVTGITVNAYHSDGSLINQDPGGVSFAVPDRYEITDLTWTQLDTMQVSLPTDMQFDFTLPFPIEADAYVEFIFPDDVPITGDLTAYTGSGLFVTGTTFNTMNQTHVIIPASAVDVNQNSVNSIVFSDILNPQKVKSTDDIQINIYESDGTGIATGGTGVNLPDTTITEGINTITNVLSDQTSIDATGVSWSLFFNPESPIINNATDQAKIRVTIPPSMTLDAA